MSVPFWPTTLPQRPIVGYSGGAQDARVSFAPDVGPPIERRRTTAAVKQFSFAYPPMSRAEQVIFETFFETTIKHASLKFIQRDPLDDAPMWWRFVAADPVYRMVATSFAHIDLSFTLMKLPGTPWFAAYVEAGTSRVPYAVADYTNSIFGVDGAVGVGSDVAAVAGTFDVYTTHTDASVTVQLNQTVVAGDIPATAPLGVTQILAFDP